MASAYRAASVGGHLYPRAGMTDRRATTCSIARVEPLTRTRALRGPFDYRLSPEHDGVTIGLGAARPVRRPAHARRGHRARRPDRRRPRSPGRPRRRGRPRRSPADLVALAGWMAHEYVSTPARALSLMLAPGAAAGQGAKLVLTASITAGRPRGAGWRGPAHRRPARARSTPWSTEVPTPAARLGTPAPCAAWRAAAWSSWSAGRYAVARRSRRVGAPLAHAAALTPDQQAALDAVSRGPGGRPGSPAAPARRHRLGQDRGLPARGRRRARGRTGRDRARARDRPDPADSGALPAALRRRGRGPALGPERGGAPRRVARAGLAGRPACASGRARLCSRRSPTSA